MNLSMNESDVKWHITLYACLDLHGHTHTRTHKSCNYSSELNIYIFILIHKVYLFCYISNVNSCTHIFFLEKFNAVLFYCISLESIALSAPLHRSPYSVCSNYKPYTKAAHSHFWRYTDVRVKGLSVCLCLSLCVFVCVSVCAHACVCLS